MENRFGHTDRGPIQWRFQRRRSPLWGVFLGALVGGIIGGVLALAAAPALLPGWVAENWQIDSSPSPAPGNGISPGAGDQPGAMPTANDSPVVRVVEQVGSSVVGIVNRRYARDSITGDRVLRTAGTGSGVIFDSRGYIVTNFHVVEGADALEVVVADGRTLEAELVAHDFPFSDLAVLRVSPSEVDDVEYAAFADSGQLRVGETVIAIGNPQGLQFFRSVTVGVVSGIRTDLLQQLGGGTSSERIFELIQTDAAINRGNSGGPLVNLAGQVVGINTLKFAAGDVEGMGFAIPSSDVRRVVEDLIEHGYVIRPAIGALLLPDEVARSRYGVDDGVIISDVVANGPSARAGLREGDVILSLGGTPTPTFLELLKEINAHQVGDAVEVKIRRDEEELSVDVELGELGPPQGR